MPKINAVDIFCGCGGLTYGLSLSGINVLAGVDIDAKCQRTYEGNNNCKFISRDISAVTAGEIKRLFRGHEGYTMVAGCAPCQPYSPINTRKFRADERRTLLDEFGRIIRGVKPHFVLMENVNGLTSKNKHFSGFIQSLDENGYYYEYKVLNARDHGVAQNRKRLFLIATRLKKIRLSFDNLIKQPEITLKDVIYHLEPIEHSKPSNTDPLHRTKILNEINLRRIQATPKNGGLRSAWSEDLMTSCHRKQNIFLDNYGRLAWDRPSSTVTTKFNEYYSGCFGHPEQDRALSLREGALIQSFPYDYEFFGSDTQIAMQIGNAVPVNLSSAVGNLFVNSLET